jgi:hypothetical protein
LNRQLPLTALLILFIVAPIVLGEIQTCNAADIPILGYPYDTSGYGGIGVEGYSLYGSSFTLNGKATITSMSCKMAMAFGYPDATAVHYRFAIYQDNAGKVGTLVAQTKEGTATPDVQGTIDQWRTAMFTLPVSLQAGKYWLIEIHEAKNVGIHSLYFLEGQADNLAPWNQSRIVLASGLSSDNFPALFESLEPFDTPAALIAIYASGQGTPSVLPPSPSPAFNGATPSRIFLSFRSVDSSTGKFQIVGNLTSNSTGVANADLTFSYRNSSESESSLHQFSTITTDIDGRFSVDWLPPSAGSYVINATYHGSDLYGPVFDGIHVLVSDFNGDKQVFSVESNSTVTSIVFDPQNSELNLSVIGQTGTTGFVEVYVSKSLVGNVSAVKAYIDNKPVEYTVSSTEYSWVLTFYYHHSSHNIVFNLSKAETTVPELPTTAMPLVLVVLILAAAGLIVMTKRLNPYTNKTNKK